MERKTRGTSLTMALVMVAAMGIPSAFGKPAKSCPKFKPPVPETEGGSARAEKVPRLPVVTINDKATANDPVVIEFEQDVAAWYWIGPLASGPIVDGNEYFNVQVETKKKNVGLHARLEWPLLPEEFDLYLYAAGMMVAGSEAFNQIPAEVSGDTGGPGYEYIAGYPAFACSGFTIESNAFWATPQTVILKLWLGPVEWNG